jgi:hypothetical protein
MEDASWRQVPRWKGKDIPVHPLDEMIRPLESAFHLVELESDTAGQRKIASYLDGGLLVSMSPLHHQFN